MSINIMSNMAQSNNEFDISPMLKDINEVLKGHLRNLLGPIISEKNAIQSVLLNMPYVKRLKAENEVMRQRLFQMKTELQTTITFYQKELENANKKNVKLEVRDRVSELDETPSKIVELKNQMWRKNEKVNSQDDEEENILYSEEDDEDDEDDEEDDEDYESPIISNIRMSLLSNKKEETVEITSAGTIESSEEENPVKNVTVWNLNDNHENLETNNEEDEEEEEYEEDEEDEEQDEEEDDEEEKEEEVEEEEDKEEEEEEDDEEEDDEEELDVEDVEIDGVQYLTTSTENGEIYKCDCDGEILEDENGDFIICGYFKNGIANFI